jgi:D-arginine dehydrogenase
VTDFDVAVIGGGIAGTSAAYFLAPQTSVVVLEREATLGVHSTGRSAALFTECYERPIVRRLAVASREFLDRPPMGFSDTPLMAPRGVAFVATADQVDRVEPSLREQQALVPSVRELPVPELLEMCPVLDPAAIVAGIYEPDAKDIDVHALHMGYRRGVLQHGGRIVPGYGVDRLEHRQGVWHLGCGTEEITARVVVNAAGAWCDMVATLASAVPVGLVPKRRTAFTFDGPPGTADWPMIVDIDEQWYFKAEGPGLLGSPGDESPVEPQDVRHREEDVAIGIERIQSVTSLSIRSIRSAWAGLRSFVGEAGPVNGWDDQVPGFYWLAGQGGFGILSSPAMGTYAAATILGQEPAAHLAAAGIDSSVLGIEQVRVEGP